MSSLKIDQVLQMTVANTDEPQLFRLLWKNERTDKAWVIQIPPKTLGNYYCKAPLEMCLSNLEELLTAHQIIVIELEKPALWSFPDDEIRTRYVRKNGRCPPLDARDMRWSWIEELVMKNSRADIFERDLITSWVTEMAAKINKTRAKLYNTIHSYFAGGSCQGALLYGWSRSGGKGKQRIQTQKMGRPNAAVKSKASDAVGYYLNETDKEKIQFSWTHFVSDKKSVHRAFLEMSGVFYRKGVKAIDDKLVPDLFPASERPTLDQFKYWGPMGDPLQAAWRKKLGALEWIKNYKGISGSAKDGSAAVGQLAFCDTTTNDVHLVSITSRLKPVGTLNRLMIYEGKSELAIGFHCGFEPPSARTFLSAVAHAASSKVEYCARFGIAVTDDMFPALAVKVYLGDNGEYRSEGAFKALKQFGAYIELAASGQAQLKGPVEGNHHVMHARLDHTLDGTTNGRQRARGEVKPAFAACLTYFEYMREFIREVLYYNVEEKVDHLLTVEMRRENVTATRIEIYHWLVKKGYVVDFVPDISILRAHLYPALPAMLTETGVYLLREDRGDAVERVWGLRYMSEYLIDSGLLAHARKDGTKRITVRGLPESPQSMWLVTDSGLIELHNITNDPILFTQATVQDCICIQNDDKVQSILDRDNSDQIRSDIECVREINVAHARDEKKREIQELPKRPTKGELTNGIEDNRRKEIALLQSMDKQNDKLNDSSKNLSLELPSETDRKQDLDGVPLVEDPAKQALLRYLKGRGKA